MKTVSHGLLILDAAGELLLCHATGSPYWDIPKGGANEGESSAQAALRETCEECGLCFALDDLSDLGGFAYLPRKDLALHAVLSERVDTRRCRCTSFFTDRHGRLRPEMDGFRWTPIGDVPRRVGKSLAAVLTRDVALAELFSCLVAHGPPSKPRPPVEAGE